jgi:tetratricopeptide (TPR) repeat protein
MNTASCFPQIFADKVFKKGLFEQCNDAVQAKRQDYEDAEILLEHGIIKGYLSSHEESKTLILKALELYEQQTDQTKITECFNQLAVAFLRNGEIEKAKLFLRKAKKTRNDFTLIVEQMILLDEKRFIEVIKLKPSESSNAFINANYHNNLAIAYRNSGNTENVAENFEFAKELFRACGHLAYLATVENNLACYNLHRKNYGLAKAQADKAIELLKECENYSRLAMAFDTKACIYLEERNFRIALDLVNEAVGLLQIYKNTLYLLECYKSKIKILAALDKYEELLLVFGLAHNLAAVHCGNLWTERYVKSIADVIFCSQTKQNAYFEIQDMQSKTVCFTKPYKKKSTIFYAKSANSESEAFGIKLGNYAVISDETAQNGDFVAVLKKYTNLVEIGILKPIVGLTVLECSNKTTKIFGNEFRVLGKVIGIGEPDNGVINVELL